MTNTLWIASALIAPLLAGAGAANAAQTVSIERAVARVTVILEPRGDVEAVMTRANARFPIRIERTADGVAIRGDLQFSPASCRGSAERPRVSVWMRGSVGADDMPQIVVRAPLSAAVRAEGAVYGAVGRGDNLVLANAGCGDWTVGDQTGALDISVTGSGDVRAGAAGRADLRVAGSGDVALRLARAGLSAAVTGSGDIDVGEVDGPLHAKVAGSGNVRVKGVTVSDMGVSVVGSGDVSFGGVAARLDAHVAGSGDISVAKVTGAVSKHVAGSGDVSVGH